MSELLTPTNTALAAAVYALPCAFAGTYVSNQKGRPSAEGFVLALLFGPFGLVVAACLPDPRVPAAADEDEDDDDDERARAHLAELGSPAPPPVPKRGTSSVVPPRPAPRRLLGEVED